MASSLLDNSLCVRLAQTDQEVRAAQALRYQVFVHELGGDGESVDHARELEIDRFDPFCDHLCLWDTASQTLVGAYRVLTSVGAQKAGAFYSESEFDISGLLSTGRNVLELGRSCLHPDFRGGDAIFHLWAALSDYIKKNNIDLLFGVASFHGTDTAKLAHPLSFLHHKHLAPTAIRPVVREPSGLKMDVLDLSEIDRIAAVSQIPQLIKSYLRLGGVVGEGAFVDHAFNTTDVCLVLDVANLTEKQRQIFERKGASNAVG